jgi:hypothetical protein
MSSKASNVEVLPIPRGFGENDITSSDPWLGHYADLTTANRYAEINTKAKQEALLRTEPPG